MKVLQFSIIDLLLILTCCNLSAFESQIILAGYIDSNPIESLTNPEATGGLKLQDRLSFKHSSPTWVYDGSLVAQAFVEPFLFLDSKLVGNAALNLRRGLTSRLAFLGSASSFQKLYLSELEHSSRSSFTLGLEHSGQAGKQQRVSYEFISSQVNTGFLYTYTDQRAAILLRHRLCPDLQLEWNLVGGLARFKDLPARKLSEGLIFTLNEDQQDTYALLGLHLKYTGPLIWGLSLSRQQISSNSALAEASTWLVRAYLSKRFGSNVYLHAVVQGMDKHYAQTLYTATTPTRDPEETIQNQVHLQLERILDSKRALYLQYSYSRNETIYNYWFYEKQLFECGLKIRL